jgi:myo-inositol 2-dehydrogenase/D-chiro-inositol 1-dehydrogenase
MSLRLGWIGCGVHANAMLLPQLARLPVRLVALCDVDPERLARTAERWSVPVEARTRDWRELLARADLDALAVAAGPAVHAEVALASIDRRLPVFVEKPPAADAATARRVALSAARAGVPVVVGFMKRFATANRIARTILRDPAFGPRASFLGAYVTAPGYFLGNPDYSGFYLHHCVHYFDLVPHLMGEVASVSVRRYQLAPGKLALHLSFVFEGGGLGSLVMGNHQSRGVPCEWWQVMGDHQRVEVRNVHEVRWLRDPPFKAERPEATLEDGVDTLVWEPNQTAAVDEDHKGYRALLEGFLRAARGEAVEALPTAADGARALELLERALGPL